MRFNSKDGAIDSSEEIEYVHKKLKSFNSKDGAIDS